MCPQCEIAAADVDVVALETAELHLAEQHIKDHWPRELRPLNLTSASIFPAFLHEATLSESLLDLLVLFFSHVVLYVDTFNLQEEHAPLVDKLSAYVEQRYVTLFSFDGMIHTSSLRALPRVTLPDGPRLQRFLDNYANLASHLDLQNATNQQIDDALKPLPFWSQAPNPLQIMKYNQVHVHVLNRLNAFYMLCRMLDMDPLFDDSLAAFGRLKYHSVVDRLAREKRSAMTLTSWYSALLADFPRFRDPESMIRYRSEVDQKLFVNFVVRKHSALLSKNVSSKQQIELAIRQAIEKEMLLSRKLTGETYKLQKRILSGLMATFGALAGGPVGAFLGGIGAATVPEAAAKIDRERLAPWASYFIGEAS